MTHPVPTVLLKYLNAFIVYCPLLYVCLLFSLLILFNLIFFLNLMHKGIFLLTAEATLDNTVL